MSKTTDTPSRELYLLENVPIQGRKTELRQLLKLLNLAKTGQPKAALITGDAGIGKSALLETFTQLVNEGIYCRVLQLGKMTLNSPEEVYVRLIEQLQVDANLILDDALIAVNEITRELDLHWERQDLIRAIALVKLQESIGGKEAVSQEQLVKAIRSQVPAIKKLKFSVNESIQKLVDLIVNPWIMIATSLLNPISPALKEAIELAETLRNNDFQLPQENKLANLLSPPAAQPKPAPLNSIESLPPVREPLRDMPRSEGVREPFAPIDQDDFSDLLQEPSGNKKLPLLVDPELNLLMEENQRAMAAAGENYPLSPAKPMPKPVQVVAPVESTPTPEQAYAGHDAFAPIRMDAPPRPIKDPLIRHLMTVFHFINASIQKLDSGMLIVLDEWDRTENMAKLAELKAFFSELVLQITEQKNYHFMLVMTARTEGESYTLGGSLYNHFRTKLLLDVLNEGACRKLVRSLFKDSKAELDEEIHLRLYGLSRGNPFWHLKIAHYMKERVESNRIREIDSEFYDKLGIDQLNNLLDLSFTRLKLTFLNDEESLYKVIAALLKHFAEAPFSANQAIKEVSASQGFTDGYVFEVLRALYRHDLIQLASGSQLQQAQGHREGNAQQDPCYIIQSRFALDFLHEKTRMIETDISTDEKIMFLKKIIPLSVKSGDLDREKTLEVLALGDAMGNAELVTFLEEVFVEAMQDPKAVVRVTALNNIALIDTHGAREAIFTALKDDDSMVREYAARNLALMTQKAHDPSLANRVIDLMLDIIDDESDAVRAQVYAALTKHRLHRDLTSVFIKGTSDACEAVRLTSIRNLTELEIQTPYVFNCLMDAMNDPLSEIRRYACLGLQRYPNAEAIDAIVKTLQTDNDVSIRSLAADSLSRMEDNKAFLALVSALRQEASEDVKLAVVRALGKRRGWQTEAVLQEALQGADYESMPVFTWACIRSLGQVAGTERSRNLLLGIQNKITNGIILSALDVAVQRISERVEELAQMERQLEEATPLAVATPSDEDHEVEVPEEEVLLDEALMREGDLLEEAQQARAAEFMDEAPLPSSTIRSTSGSSFLESVGGRSHSLLKLPFDRNN